MCYSDGMISLIILDADGVLINGEPFRSVRARELDIDKAKEEEFFAGIFQECLVGRADLKESIAPYLPSFGWRGTVDEFLDWWFKTESGVDQTLVSYVRQLRQSGVKVVLATNQEKYRTQYMLEQMGFDGKFDKIYSSALVGLKKPAVEFYAYMVEDMGTSKDEVLFWDDDQGNIDGALEYGIKAHFYEDYDSFLRVMQDEYGMPAPDAPVSIAV